MTGVFTLWYARSVRESSSLLMPLTSLHSQRVSLRVQAQVQARV